MPLPGGPRGPGQRLEVTDLQPEKTHGKMGIHEKTREKKGDFTQQNFAICSAFWI